MLYFVARYTKTRRFHNSSSVTSMLDHLQWNTQKHNAVQNNTQHVCHQYISQTSHTRHSRSLQYQTFSISTDYFMFSFFPQAVVLWIALKPDIVSASSAGQLKSPIQTHYKYKIQYY